ncbi:aldo/keto reductase [Flavobacteriaceae bacterium Ap0902]|nr:aldo/keto reductase [Flavobacteriaceae bacterium Ap0902]
MNNETSQNKLSLPPIGFGTYKIEGVSNDEIIIKAIEEGYRLIDTAAYYGNEEIVGEAIKKSSVPREDLIITTKVWREDLGYDKVMKSVEDSLQRLQLDYLDIVLLHWPANRNLYGDQWQEVNTRSWKALEELYRKGTVKAIGISNYTLPYLKPLLETVQIMPMINQIEFHPGYWQPEVYAFCKNKGMAIQAWSPLARGKVFDAPIIRELAGKYNKSEAQICLRWNVEKDVLPIPKTSNPERMRENKNIFDFKLTKAEVIAIDNLPQMGYSEHHPDNRV